MFAQAKCLWSIWGESLWGWKLSGTFDGSEIWKCLLPLCIYLICISIWDPVLHFQHCVAVSCTFRSDVQVTWVSQACPERGCKTGILSLKCPSNVTNDGYELRNLMPLIWVDLSYWKPSWSSIAWRTPCTKLFRIKGPWLDFLALCCYTISSVIKFCGVWYKITDIFWMIKCLC